MFYGGLFFVGYMRYYNSLLARLQSGTGMIAFIGQLMCINFILNK